MFIHRLTKMSLLVLALASSLAAHFVFVTPDSGGQTARVFISEDLTPDVDVKIIKGTRLHLMRTAGGDVELSFTQPEPTFFSVNIPGSGTRVVYGKTDFGVSQRGNSKPHRLVYYPKAIVGDAFAKGTVVGDRSVVEIIPEGKPGSMKLRLLAHGKPVPDAEIVMLLPDGTEERTKTDASGLSAATYTELGRYGAWARFWETTSGTLDGKAYEEVRHYATLVADVGSAEDLVTSLAPVRTFAKLPHGVSSFGATVSDGWLYVYGGHTARTHNYSKESVSGEFYRLALSKPDNWESLPSGPGVQGLNLASYKGQVIRVGGMMPRNEKGQPSDNHSINEVAVYKPGSKKWDMLPTLPEPRSSHDIVVLGGKLYVIGGWIMEGATQRWPNTMLVLDLASRNPQWETLSQPFARRAFMAAAHNGKLYVVGGITEKGSVVRTVSIYDPASGTWAEGPQLPDGEYLGFSPALGEHRGTLYVALGDGRLMKLEEDKKAWTTVSKVEPRVAHRLVSAGDQLLVLGGAAKGNNLDLVEAVRVAN